MKSTIKKSMMAASLAIAAASPSYAQVPDLGAVTGLLSLDALPISGLAGGDFLALVPLDALSGGGVPGLDVLGGGLPGLDALPVGALAGGGLPGLDALPIGALAGGDFLALIPLDALGGGLPGGDLAALIPVGGFTGAGSGLSSIPGLGGGLDFIVNGSFLSELLPDPVELAQLAGGTAIITELGTGALSNPDAVFSTVNELGINAGVAAVPVLAVLLENPAGLLDYFTNGGTILTQALDGTNGNSVAPGVPLLTQPLGL